MAPPSPDLSLALFNSTSRLLSILDLNDQHDTETMDIDQVTVPDTPDRLSVQNTNTGVNAVEEIQSSPVACSYGISSFRDKGVYNRVNDRGKLNIDRANSKRSIADPQGDNNIHGEIWQNIHSNINLVDSSSLSKNAYLFENMLSEKVSSQPEFTGNVTSSCDRTKLDGDTENIAELVAGNDKTQGKNKEKMGDLISSQNGPYGKYMRKKTQGNMLSDIDDGLYVSAAVGMDCEKGKHLPRDSKQNTEQPRSLQSTSLPRRNGQRRLVLNGCISPHNIAKAKSTAESHEKICENGTQDDRVSPSHIDLVSPMSGGNQTTRVKGKGIAQKYNIEALHSSSRSSLKSTEETNRMEDANRVASNTIEGRGGWRSTRNRSNNTSITSSDSVGHFSSTSNGVGHEISDPVSVHRGRTPLSAQVSSGIRSEMGKESGWPCVTNKIARRQRKRGSTSSNSGECSTSTLDDSEIAFLCSSEEPSNARSTRSRSIRSRGNLHPIIEIDDSSPEVRNGGPQNTTHVVDDDTDARARQMEADEMLARELQEQFYDELPGVGGGEVDANIAWTLQQEEQVQHASSLRRQRVHPRDASMSHLYRQHQPQVLQNSLIRSTTRANRGRARAPTFTRGTRLRERFAGSSSTISSGERNIRFHPNIDVEMRIHILEALEAAVGTDDDMIPNSILQLQRDFNENDYEMLLALDEDNHRHVGANPGQINGLPQSIVQSENFAEDCAICLETPTIGDTIRHLPCLHKFHKDCIDPWLRRKTSCPVCKSGIT